jgi:hypothetical protein
MVGPIEDSDAKRGIARRRPERMLVVPVHYGRRSTPLPHLGSIRAQRLA